MRVVAVAGLLCATLMAVATPVDDAVAAISTDNLLNNIRYLSGATSSIATRYAPTAGSAAAQNWLQTYFQSLGYQVTIQDWGKWSGYTCSDNVIARKTGSRFPNDVYVICAHYDSTSPDPWNLAPGADDNASGTSSVMEAARVLRDLPTEYTIEFCCFSGEEEGLLGSSYYVSHPGSKTFRGTVNLDMVAYQGTGGLSLAIGSPGGEDSFTGLVRHMCWRYNPGMSTTNTSETGSDHYPFHQHGYRDCLIIEANYHTNPNYHKVTDTWDYLSPNLMHAAACAAIGTVGYAANTGAVTGMVILPGYAGDLSNVSVTIERREILNPRDPVETYSNVALDSDGQFTIPNVPPGLWHFLVKKTGWLDRWAINVAVPIDQDVAVTMDPGDATGDNSVDLLDLAQVLAQFGGAGTADFDGSGIVNLIDLGMVMADFGEKGDGI